MEHFKVSLHSLTVYSDSKALIRDLFPLAVVMVSELAITIEGCHQPKVLMKGSLRHEVLFCFQVISL